jgi:glycosyltransferase involved in cell wall biosynthesis
MYNLEVLVATMHKENKEEILNLLDNMRIDSDCVVVSQCNKNGIEYAVYKNHNITIVYSTERGLSKSRNLALEHATADIAVIADDDVCFTDNYGDMIIAAYNEYPQADILTFRVKKNKKYFQSTRKLNYITIHKVASWEITLKINSVKNVRFNEIFGAGSPYFQCGEENIFLKDCLKTKKSIIYVPKKIGYFPENPRPSTWFTGFDKKYMISQGAVYYELSHFLAIPYTLQFAIRKHGLYKKNLAIYQAIHYMINGMLKYKSILKKS